LLNAKLDGKINAGKGKPSSEGRSYYYFSPFEQFIQDENKKTEMLDPSDNSDEANDATLHNRIDRAKANKSTDAFKQHKRDIESRGQTSMTPKT
jgi:hypothetical protein